MYPARASRSRVYQEEASKALKLEARIVEEEKRGGLAHRLIKELPSNIIFF
jgi:hypothetical protein